MAPASMTFSMFKDMGSVFSQSKNNVNHDQNAHDEENIERQCENFPSNNNNDDQNNSWFKNVFRNCCNFVQNNNMDIPLNRCLVCIGYYFIFLGMILTTILSKNDEVDDSER